LFRSILTIYPLKRGRALYNFAVWVAGSLPRAKEEVMRYIEEFIKAHIVPLKGEERL
jgi:hypothetical protein